MKLFVRWLFLAILLTFPIQSFATSIPETNTPTANQTTAVVIKVAPGGNLQSAIDNAQLGDTIVLEAGATYTGDFVLPNKSGTGYITIQSSRAAELPEGVRVGPAQSALFARLHNASSASPVIRTAAGAHHYRLIGLEITTPTTALVYDLVRFGESNQTSADVPHDLVVDRSYIHGHSTQDVQRGIALNGAEISVLNSYISDIHGRGFEAQALCGWNGPGPFKIINNYLEGAGENILFGGSDPSIPNLIPSNIEIRGNYLFKPLSWKVGHPTYAGIHWGVKNLLELKMARNVIIDGNILENCWGDAQIGYAVLFTVRNQDGKAPWATLENVQFTNNIVKNSEQGFQLLGKDSPNLSLRASGLLIANNRFIQIANRFFTVNGYYNVNFEHNTHEQGGNIISFDGELSLGFSWKNNVTVRNPNGYGVFGGGVGEGNVALAAYAPGGVFAGNVIVGADVRFYPPDNHYPSDLSGLPSLKGTDGLVPGYGGAIPLPSPTPDGSPTPTPTPTPVPPTPSLDGTKDVTITDNSSGTWTLGAKGETLRNGVWLADGMGLIYKWLGGVVYVQGTNESWYKWVSTRWEFVGAEPSPSPTPTPTPTPSPSPSPSPTPSPTPVGCTITAPTSIVVPRRGTQTVAVGLTGLTGTVTVNAVPMSGQITVQPSSKVVNGTSASLQFSVIAKQNSSSVRFDSPCGSKTTVVTVR